MKLDMQRSKPVNHGPQMTLEDAALACKVELNWLRNFVGRAGVRPQLVHHKPTRRYYSLIQIRDALRKERRGLPS